MPAPGKPFEVFVAEDRLCRDFAAQSIGNTADQSSRDAVNSAVVGTAVGAAAEATKEAGKEMVAKAADATKEAADATKEAADKAKAAVGK